MEIASTRFGRVEYDTQSVIRFPLGVAGFDDCREWILLADPRSDAVAWLQSISRPELAMAVVSPRRFIPSYRLRVARQEIAPFEGDALRHAEVLAIVSKTDHELTVNLKAPLVLDVERRIGRQLVANGDAPLQYKVDSDTAEYGYRRSA